MRNVTWSSSIPPAIASRGIEIGYKDDRHVLTIAASRSGKGRSLIINNLSRWPGDMLVLDVKGENALTKAEHRGHAGLCVVLDPFGERERHSGRQLPMLVSFNPFDELAAA